MKQRDLALVRVGPASPGGEDARIPAGGKVREAVRKAVRDYRAGAPRPKSLPIPPPTPTLRPIRPGPGGVIAPMPRPRRLGIEWKGQASPPRRDDEVFKAGPFQVMGRIFVWLSAGFRFFGGALWDRLRGRDTEERRARRLRRIVEGAGITFVKIGQQMSMRIDLIPYLYAHELEKMLDSVHPFPAEQAIEAVEQAAGRPLHEVFAVFDPEPIGSASVACVYQGVLRDGRRVAVKVRRPGIGQMLAADMGALTVLARCLELYFLPPGFSHHLIFELRTMLEEELDFVKEARFNELFRRRARKAKLRFVTSPRIHFDLSSKSVLVAELISGIPLSQLVGAVENRDDKALAELSAQGIEPGRVARRYLRVNRFGGFENLFFHADLHPANVLVQPGSRLVLIDFGSCGSFPRRELNIWRRLLDAQSREDVGDMVQAALALLEPLPLIDVDEFSQRLEAVFWQDLYAFKSRHARWWERTSATIWISFLKLAREYCVPMNLNTLRMVRATMLTDTVAARLDKRIDHYAEYRDYEKGAGKRARKRLHKRIGRTLFHPSVFLRLEQLFEAGFGAVYRLQRVLDSRSFFSFTAEVGKAAFSLALLLKLTFRVSLLTLSLVGIVKLSWDFFPSTRVEGLGHDVVAAARFVASQGWYQVTVVLMAVLTFRNVLHRLFHKDV
ncbi:MAG: AarF/ABC1/UbiB kinase family protein [Acidobacteriota bacterium]